MTAGGWPARLSSVPLGTRIVLRYLVPGGATDALGDLVALDDTHCVVRTRRGDVTVPLADVVLGKPVPPPPVRRRPPRSTGERPE